MRASTHSPISRLAPSRCCAPRWIVLPWPTRTRCRSSVSSRRAGNGRSRGQLLGQPLPAGPRCAAPTAHAGTAAYAARLAKSRLPRSSSACSTASLNRRCALLAVAVLVAAGRR